MENELINEESWWKRNRKWVLIALVVFFVAIALLIGISGTLGNFGRAYADLPLYERAIQHAQANNDVNNKVGNIRPIDKMTIAEGNVAYVGDSVSATITIKGVKSKAKLDIAALKTEGSWNYKLIKVRIKEPKQEIVVLQRE